jgi:hypothetical protein
MSQTAQTATLATVAASAASTELFAEAYQALGPVNGRAVFNDSTSVLYLKFGATASETNYTVQIAGGGYYEFPQPLYAGEVDGIWASATGNARLTSW